MILGQEKRPGDGKNEAPENSRRVERLDSAKQFMDISGESQGVTRAINIHAIDQVPYAMVEHVEYSQGRLLSRILERRRCG